MGVGSNPTSDNNLFLAFASSDSLMLNIISQLNPVEDSRVAQWKRAGPITQRSVDRNHALLSFFFNILTHSSTVVRWCSGYHVCFTRRRSPVRAWHGSNFDLLRFLCCQVPIPNKMNSHTSSIWFFFWICLQVPISMEKHKKFCFHVLPIVPARVS